MLELSVTEVNITNGKTRIKELTFERCEKLELKCDYSLLLAERPRYEILHGHLNGQKVYTKLMALEIWLETFP